MDSNNRFVVGVIAAVVFILIVFFSSSYFGRMLDFAAQFKPAVPIEKTAYLTSPCFFCDTYEDTRQFIEFIETKNFIGTQQMEDAGRCMKAIRKGGKAEIVILMMEGAIIKFCLKKDKDAVAWTHSAFIVLGERL